MNELLLKMGVAALIAGGVAIGSVPLVKKLAAKYGAVRAPRERDIHKEPMPLWGGVAMFLGFMVAVLIVRLWAGQDMAVAVGKGQHPVLGILLGATLIAIVGMLDDRYDLPPRVQAGALLTAGFVAAILGARVEGITNPFAHEGGHGYTSDNWIRLHPALSIGATMAWVFLVAKTVDFLDGMDGLAAGVCTIAALAMGMMAAARGDMAVAYMSAALVGACLGFLRHNYNPASIFMGTVGAQFLGFILAMLAVVGTLKVQAAISIVVALLVLGVPVFDGLYVVGRRMYLRQKATSADNTHIHHRLRKRGLSVPQVVWAVYAITASCCLLAVLLAWKMAR